MHYGIEVVPFGDYSNHAWSWNWRRPPRPPAGRQSRSGTMCSFPTEPATPGCVPTDYPYAEFKDIYLYAHKQGLKGCTTFRFNRACVFRASWSRSMISRARPIMVFAKLEDGSVVEAKGNDEIEYDGETHTAANLFDALKEGYYGKF